MEIIHPPRALSMDRLIKELAGGVPGYSTPFENMLMWESRAEGAIYQLPVLQAAIRGEDYTKTVKFEPITQTQDLVDRFWRLHSKYFAPSAVEVRVLYEDLLGHCIALEQRYGRSFIAPNSKVFRELVEALAEECGKPDEAEVSRVSNAEAINQIYQSENFAVLLQRWVGTQRDPGLSWTVNWEPEYRDQVNFDLLVWIFRVGGVLDRCLGLIRDVCKYVQTLGHGAIEAFCQFDMAKLGEYRSLRSSILLGCSCEFEAQLDVTLTPDWWVDPKTQHLIRFPASNRAVREELTTLFVFSNVDSPAGIHLLLDFQQQQMNGTAKTPDSYQRVKQFITEQGDTLTPWRTKNGAWPMDSVVENGNYQAIEEILRGVRSDVVIRSKVARRREEPAETVEPPKRPKKASAPLELIEKPVEIIQEKSYAFWGGLAAVTLGLGAIAFSNQRQVR